MSNTITHLDKQTGVLRDDGVYVSHRTRQHYFRKYKGFGISYMVLLNLRRMGCHTICIIYDDGTTVKNYRTPLIRFIKEGIVYRDKMLDFQRILPLKRFEHDGTLPFYFG